MAKKVKEVSGVAAEIAAIGAVHAALENLSGEAQSRVLSYVSGVLNIAIEAQPHNGDPVYPEETAPPTSLRSTSYSPPENTSGDAEGINSVALRFMKRSGIEPKDLQKIFSLGIDEIDLVAPKVAGTSKRERFHNVLLLKGIAAYLGTGTAKVTYEQLKEASLHYNAFDPANAATYLKNFSADWTGSKSAGYTLSARGLTNGISVVKSMIEQN